MGRYLRCVAFWLIAVLGLAVGVPLVADGQETTLDASPFVALLPALRTASSPRWVHPGLRLTYFSAAATISGAASGGASGQGFTQITVAALDRAVVALDLRSYSLLNGTGPAYLLADSGAVSRPGAGMDWWMNPDVLKTAAGLSGPQLKVIAGPYRFKGHQYQALWFTTGSAEGRQTWVYDRASGLLLHSAAETNGAQRGLAQNTFVGMRTLNVPWSSAGAPPWVAQTTELHYAGASTLAAASYLAGVPVSMAFQRLGFGPNWARYASTLTMRGGVPTQGTAVAGSGLLDGLWVPPAELAGFRSGQILDVDPQTHVQVAVGQIGQGGRGPVVTITETNEGNRIEFVYDGTTGLLLASTLANNILGAQLKMRLVERR